MISSKKRNKTYFYRRLSDMTQQNAADILNSVKSNVANMESEKHIPSEIYRKFLKMTPRQLLSPLLTMEHTFYSALINRFCSDLTENGEFLKLHKRKAVFDSLCDNPPEKNNAYQLKLVGEFNGTDVYAWKTDFDIPSLKIKRNSVLPVMPRLIYTDGSVILYRYTLSKYKVAKIFGNGEEFLSLIENEPAPILNEIEIIGEIILK